MRLWVSFWRLRLWRAYIAWRYPEVRPWELDKPERPPLPHGLALGIIVALAVCIPMWAALVWWLW